MTTELTLALPEALLDRIRAEAREAAISAATALVRAELSKADASRALPPGDMKFAKRSAYARRIGMSVRKLDQLIGRGLPTIGAGRLRRIDVEAADAWLRAERGR